MIGPDFWEFRPPLKKKAAEVAEPPIRLAIDGTTARTKCLVPRDLPRPTAARLEALGRPGEKGTRPRHGLLPVRRAALWPGPGPASGQPASPPWPVSARLASADQHWRPQAS